MVCFRASVVGAEVGTERLVPPNSLERSAAALVVAGLGAVAVAIFACWLATIELAADKIQRKSKCSVGRTHRAQMHMNE